MQLLPPSQVLGIGIRFIAKFNFSQEKQAYNLHVTSLFFFIFVQYYTECMCLLSLVSNLQLYELKNNPQVYTIQYGIGINVFLLIHRRYTTCDIINWYMYYFILFIDDQYFFSS